MSQQINLYNALLRKKRVWLTLNTLVISTAAIGLVLLLAGAYFRVQASTIMTESAALDARIVAARNELSRLASDGQAGQTQAELANLQMKLAARRAVLDALQAGAGFNQPTQGFSEYLAGLARQTVPGLWLTGFTVAQGGANMEIRGRMLSAERLPVYLQGLKQEDVFRGRHFVHLLVERPVGSNKAASDRRSEFNEFHLSAVNQPAAAGARK